MPVVSDYTAILGGNSWWGPSTTGRPIFLTYSFNSAVQPYVAGNYPQEFLETFMPLTSDERATARNALSQWADASGITFFEVPAGQGDLQFGKYDFNTMASTTGFTGFAIFPNGPGEFDHSGDVFLSWRRINIPAQIFLHEIGHALGLKHSFVEPNVLPPNLDNWGQTVMSYTSGGFTGSTLGPLDIQAIQRLYGTPDRDGTQVASWSWDPVQYILTQTGSAAADIIHGVHPTDKMWGGAGNDALLGDAGNDELHGEDGNDAIYAGNGDDIAFGGAGRDIIYGEAAAIQWIGNDFLYGGDGDDTIYGERGSLEAGGTDHLFGENGDDMLAGDGGDDWLMGGAGNDTLNGATGFDIASYADATSGVSVNLAIALAQDTSGAGIDTLLGLEGLTGSAFDDVLTGDHGDNVLDGGAGSDVLIGGGGVDTGVFSGQWWEYTISQSGTSTIISGANGTDTLTEVERLTLGDLVVEDTSRIIVWKCVMPVRQPEFVSLMGQQAFEPQAPQFAPDWSGVSVGNPLVSGADPQASFGIGEHSTLGTPSLFGAS